MPAIVIATGPGAVAAYDEYFASVLTRPGTRAIYRSQSNQFLAWLDGRAATLHKVQPDHLAAFLHERACRHSRASVAAHASAIRGLFRHLHQRGIVAEIPMVGVAVDSTQSLGDLRAAVRELSNGAEDTEDFRAGMVVFYPIVIGGMDPVKIAAFTGIPLEEVRTYVARLRENHIWCDDGKISVTADDMTGPEGIVELCLQIGCAKGIFCRVPSEDTATPCNPLQAGATQKEGR